MRNMITTTRYGHAFTFTPRMVSFFISVLMNQYVFDHASLVPSISACLPAILVKDPLPKHLQCTIYLAGPVVPPN